MTALEGLPLAIARFLVTKARKKSRTTYQQVGQAIGWAHPTGRGLGDHLYEVLHYCKDHGLPPLTTIVVKRGERHPAPDSLKYIAAALGKIDIDKAQTEVFRFDWSNAPELSSIELSRIGTEVWLTSFWGFDPANWGCIGFATEAMRRHFIERTRKGALVAIYVTKAKGPANMRGKVVGILEVSGKAGHAKDFISGDRWELKERDPESKGKWLYAVEVTRAWKIAEEEWADVESLLPTTYASAHPESIGSYGVPIAPNEAEKLLALTVFEVPVHGQTGPIDGSLRSFEDALKPTNAVHPATEPYWVGEVDGPKHLYVLRLDGDIATFLGRSRSEIGDRIVVKVGFSRSPLSRRDQIQGAYPAGAFNWRVIKPDPIPTDPPYSCADVAIAGEDAMKARLIDAGAESLGGEFFLADAGGVQGAWGAGIVAAESKAKTIREK